jgi:hypothetical protein
MAAAAEAGIEAAVAGDAVIVPCAEGHSPPA